MTEQTNPMREWMQGVREFFERVIRVFGEADADFAPADGMFTTAQQIAHTAQCVDWVMPPLTEGGPLAMDFEAADKAVRDIKTLAEARAWWDKSFDALLAWVETAPQDKMCEPCVPADSPILANANAAMLLSCVEDHTAHHRGSLAVYARLQGKVPPMPYMDV